MGLDIRLPLGMLFAAVGAMMLIFGIATHGTHIYTRSLGVNLNLEWGIVLFAFGVLMYALSRRGAAQRRTPVEGHAEPLRRSGFHH